MFYPPRLLLFPGELTGLASDIMAVHDRPRQVVSEKDIHMNLFRHHAYF